MYLQVTNVSITNAQHKFGTCWAEPSSPTPPTFCCCCFCMLLHINSTLAARRLIAHQMGRGQQWRQQVDAPHPHRINLQHRFDQLKWPQTEADKCNISKKEKEKKNTCNLWQISDTLAHILREPERNKCKWIN